MLVQSYIAVPKELRKLLNNIITYKISKVETLNIFQEHFEGKKECMDEIMKNIFNVPHSYMILNADEQRIYKNMDTEIIIDMDE